MATAGDSVGETPAQLALLVKTLLDLQVLEVPVRWLWLCPPNVPFILVFNAGRLTKSKLRMIPKVLIQSSESCRAGNIDSPFEDWNSLPLYRRIKSRIVSRIEWILSQYNASQVKQWKEIVVVKLTLPPRCKWDLRSSGVSRSVDW
jgi:hypothetical protein